MLQSFAPEFVTVEPPDSQDSAGRCARCKEKTSGLHPVRGSPRDSLLWRHFSSLHFLCHREESKDPRRGATPGDLEHSVSNRTTKWCLHDFLLLDFFEEKNFLIMFTVQILSHVGLFATPWTAAPPGSPVLHYLPEFAQTHVHWVDEAIQPSHPLSLPFSSCSQSSQHPDPSQWVGSLHLVVKVLELLNVTYYFMTQFESFCISRKRAILMLNC